MQEWKVVFFKSGNFIAMFVDAPAQHALVIGNTGRVINELGSVDQSLHHVCLYASCMYMY